MTRGDEKTTAGVDSGGDSPELATYETAAVEPSFDQFDIGEMKSIVAAATPGPWLVHRCGFSEDGRACGIGVNHSRMFPEIFYSDNREECSHPVGAADADFIAKAREWVPQLIGALLAQRAISQVARERIESMQASSAQLRQEHNEWRRRALDEQHLHEVDSSSYQADRVAWAKRVDELLATVARISRETPYPDELKGWEAQRAAMVAEVGTLRAQVRNAEADRDSARESRAAILKLHNESVEQLAEMTRMRDLWVNRAERADSVERMLEVAKRRLDDAGAGLPTEAPGQVRIALQRARACLDDHPPLNPEQVAAELGAALEQGKPE